MTREPRPWGRKESNVETRELLEFGLFAQLNRKCHLRLRFGQLDALQTSKCDVQRFATPKAHGTSSMAATAIAIMRKSRMNA